MAIQVVRDEDPAWMPAENCAFCKTSTRYWYTPRDVAVCQTCAEIHNHSDVPTKREWINANLLEGQKPLPKNWKCNKDLQND